MERNKEGYERLALWKLPDAVLFQVVSFVAPPTHRAAVICHQLALLSRDATKTLLRETASLWDIILREDYQVREHDDDPGKKGASRRACKRLRRSVLQRVQSAHRKCTNTGGDVLSTMLLTITSHFHFYLILLRRNDTRQFRNCLFLSNRNGK